MTGQPLKQSSIIIFFLALLGLSFLLRIFYSNYLFEDDGLWFTAAEEIRRGKALYSEIYFDKPPVLPLLYALLFKIFGAHIIVIRVFTIFYAVAVAWMLYRFGSELYGRREGLIAAAFFTLFSTTYLTGHMQGLNTDFLMTLPYSAAAYFFVRSYKNLLNKRFALIGGVFVGIAFQINPKAVFDFVFLAVTLISGCYLAYRNRANNHAEAQSKIRESAELSQGFGMMNLRSASRIFLLALTGFIAGSIPFFIYIAATHSLSAYWADVWIWGSRYAGYFPARTIPGAAVRYISGYFALNSALLVTLLIVLASFIKKVINHTRRHYPINKNDDGNLAIQSDGIALLWFVVSVVGITMGGRFYGHYFFQIIPALCLIGGHGITILIESIRAERGKSKLRLIAASVVLALIIIGASVALVRFHTRTLILANDFFSGHKSQSTDEWYHEQLNREELLASAAARDVQDKESVIASGDVESLREGGPRERPIAGQTDYLFVWGYRPELYYWSGLIPASRYLSTQMLTGVPADVHYYHEESRSIMDESTTAAARAELVRELEAIKPKYIIDEVGMFNNELAMIRYAELREFLRAYKRLDRIERFRIYRRKDMSKKKKKKGKARDRIQTRAQEPAR